MPESESTGRAGASGDWARHGGRSGDSCVSSPENGPGAGEGAARARGHHHVGERVVAAEDIGLKAVQTSRTAPPAAMQVRESPHVLATPRSLSSLKAWGSSRSRGSSPDGLSRSLTSTLRGSIRDHVSEDLPPPAPRPRQTPVRVVERQASKPQARGGQGSAASAGREKSLLMRPQWAAGSMERSARAVQKYHDTNIALPAFADDLDISCSGDLRLCLPANIIDNRSVWYIAWWWMILAFCFWTAFYVPLNVAFMFSYDTYYVPEPGGEPSREGFEYRPPVYAVLLMAISSLLFVTDIFINFNLAVTRNGLSVVDRSYIASQYLRSSFALDVIGAVQLGSLIVYATDFAFPVSDNDSDAEQKARWLYLLDFLTLLRLRRIWQLAQSFNLHMKDGRLGTLVIIRNILVVFFWVHWAACIFFLICELDTQSQCGIFAKDFPVDDVSIMGWYLLSFYWSIITFSTVGYGDISPAGIPGLAFTMLFILGSLTITAYVVGTITSSLSIQDSRNMALRQTRKHLRQFAKSHHISRHVEMQIEDELRLTELVREQGEDAALDGLPLPIRNAAFRFVYLRNLEKCPLFNHCSSGFLGELLSTAHIEVFTRESCILNMFDDVKHLSIVAFGSAVVGFGHISSSDEAGPVDERQRAFRESIQNISLCNESLDDKTREALQNQVAFIPSVAGPSDVFGAISFFTDMPQPETVTVSSSLCHVIMIPREAYKQASEHYPADAFRVINTLYEQAQELYFRLSGEDFDLYDSDSFFGSFRGRSSLSDFAELSHSGRNDGDRAASAAGVLGDGLPPSGPKGGESLDLPDQVRKSLSQISLQHSQARKSLESYLSALLLNAAARDNGGELEELLESTSVGGIDPVNLTDAYGRTCLMVACKHGHGRLAQRLIWHGADVNAVDKDGGCALIEAVKQGHPSLVRLLRSNGAEANLPAGQAARLLCSAVSRSAQAELLLLLDAGLDLADKYHGSGTALHIAAARGNIPALRLLLEKGNADPWLTDNQGRNPAQVAAAAGHTGAESIVVEEQQRRLSAQTGGKAAADLRQQQ